MTVHTLVELAVLLLKMVQENKDIYILSVTNNKMPCVVSLSTSGIRVGTTVYTLCLH